MNVSVYLTLCHKHTNPEREKEPKPTVSYPDLELKQDKKCFYVEDVKGELGLLCSLNRMLRKKNRTDKKTIEQIFKKGRFLNSGSLNFKFISNSGQENPRISCIVPKNIQKLASKRNSLRRRGYNALQKQLHCFPSGFVGVLIFNKSNVSVTEIEKEIKLIVSKL